MYNLICEYNPWHLHIRPAGVAAASLTFPVGLLIVRLVWGLPEGCEGPVCRISLPALPHDHPVRHDPQTQSGIRIAQPPQHRHRR